MRKNVNKLATLALSGMMVMSMALPAFAAPGAAAAPTQNFSAPVIKKVLYTDGHTYAPATTFHFDVAFDSATHTFKDGNSTIQELGTPTDTHDNVAVKVAEIPFKPADGLGLPLDAHGRYFEKSGNITVDTTKFPGPGYYLFNMTERNDGYEGIRYDESTYKLLVIITLDASGNKHSQVTVSRMNADGSLNAKTEYLGNNYGRENTPPDTPDKPPITPDTLDKDVHDVTIKKVVTGDMVADLNKKFKLTVTINPTNKTGMTTGLPERYQVTGEGTATAEDDFIEAGTPKSFDVQNGGSGFNIHGLTDGDMITVKEENGESYTMTVKADEANKVSSVITTDYAGVTNYTTPAFAALKNGAKVTIQNHKGSITPTGIVMSVAPYALMLAVAGGLGVVFFNRKKEEE